MALHVWETFNWRVRSVARPPLLLLENYHNLCLDFILAVVQEAARDFRILILVQVTFYAMVVNEALELGVLSRTMEHKLARAKTTTRLKTVLELMVDDMSVVRALGLVHMVQKASSKAGANEQARAMLSCFESGDANPEEVVVEITQRQEEDKHHCAES
ncbi:hypothetical protein Cgig2_020664 [Carnegiea gigantea]|uniref:Uncharacterized protein n=1 Tax=Carnegiea gigantea TaxID=171969 RepID=A0A9Q1QIM2_9CARY|nr:hypothetical protein Cgig2_020664 [Carnegiea gigantea]